MTTQPDLGVVLAPAMPAMASRQRAVALAVKRTIDVTVASVVLLLALPLMAFVALAIKVDTRGPVLFRQERVGRDLRPIVVLKFRSMVTEADPELHRTFLDRQRTVEGGAASDTGRYKLDRDPRVTRVGRVIRRLSIDELPQLVNVLRGEMSLVGPRPDVPYSLRNYEPWHFERFTVLPGLTGLWQVSGRSRLPYRRMLELDVEYARRWSVWLDLRILARTMGVVLDPGSAA